MSILLKKGFDPPFRGYVDDQNIMRGFIHSKWLEKVLPEKSLEKHFNQEEVNRIKKEFENGKIILDEIVLVGLNIRWAIETEYTDFTESGLIEPVKGSDIKPPYRGFLANSSFFGEENYSLEMISGFDFLKAMYLCKRTMIPFSIVFQNIPNQWKEMKFFLMDENFKPISKLGQIIYEHGLEKDPSFYETARDSLSKGEKLVSKLLYTAHIKKDSLAEAINYLEKGFQLIREKIPTLSSKQAIKALDEYIKSQDQYIKEMKEVHSSLKEEMEEVANFERFKKNIEHRKSDTNNNEETASIFYNNFSGEIWFNGFNVRKKLVQTQDDSINNRVFSYIYINPNKQLSLDEISKNTAWTQNIKSIHKILHELGFKGELKTLFFRVSVAKGVLFKQHANLKEANINSIDELFK